MFKILLFIFCFITSSAMYAQDTFNKYNLKPMDSGYSGPYRQGASFLFSDTLITKNLRKGDDDTFTFSFVNDGTDTLIISRVTSSCPCVPPTWTSEKIPPGYRSAIVGRYNTKHIGPIRKTITVYGNNWYDQSVTLYVRGWVDSLSVPVPPFGR